MTRTQRFLTGFLTGYAHMILATIAGLWLTPFFLHHLGQRMAGLEGRDDALDPGQELESLERFSVHDRHVDDTAGLLEPGTPAPRFRPHN